jgi:hypothetical protein
MKGRRILKKSLSREAIFLKVAVKDRGASSCRPCHPIHAVVFVLCELYFLQHIRSTRIPFPRPFLCTLLQIVILYSVQEHPFIDPCYEKSAFVVSLPNCDQSCIGRTHCLLFLVRFLCVSMRMFVCSPCACVLSDLAYIFFQGCGSALIYCGSRSSRSSSC